MEPVYLTSVQEAWSMLGIVKVVAEIDLAGELARGSRERGNLDITETMGGRAQAKTGVVAVSARCPLVFGQDLHDPFAHVGGTEVGTKPNHDRECEPESAWHDWIGANLEQFA